MPKIIMGVQVLHRNDEAVQVQKLLSEYGCFIKTRLGLHNATDDRTFCSDAGLIIIEFISDAEQEAREMIEKLEKLGSITVRTMEF
jgi:hypothetical protein